MFADNGKAALDLLAIRQVDLVLADLHMPEMGGVEMAARILADERTRRIPVVVVSAEPSARRLNQLTRQGVRAYVRKPFSPEAIRKVGGAEAGQRVRRGADRARYGDFADALGELANMIAGGAKKHLGAACPNN